MNKLPFLLLAGMLAISNANFAQELDSADFNNFKKFLPYMIKGMAKEKPANITEDVSGKFKKPWTIKKIEKNESEIYLDKFILNSEFDIIKDYYDDWKLEFSSKLENFGTIEEIHKSNAIFSNAYVAITEIEISDSIGNFIYQDGSDKSIKNNIGTELNINSSQIHTTFLIGKKYDSVIGNISLSLMEYGNIYYKEFENSFDSASFNLGEYKNITLLKVEANRAYFVTPTKIKNLEISSTNENSETFVSNTNFFLPKRVYDFGLTKNTDDSAINQFIESLTIDEVYKNSQVIVYETNGLIKNLYIYIKSDPKLLGRRKLQIKL